MLINGDARGTSLQEEEGERGSGLTVECDAVVVGSGAGGAVMAYLLAEAGLKVVVLEKGSYILMDRIATLSEPDGFHECWERGAAMSTQSGGACSETPHAEVPQESTQLKVEFLLCCFVSLCLCSLTPNFLFSTPSYSLFVQSSALFFFCVILLYVILCHVLFPYFKKM